MIKLVLLIITCTYMYYYFWVHVVWHPFLYILVLTSTIRKSTANLAAPVD